MIDLSSFIKVYKSAISDFLCDKVLKEFENENFTYSTVSSTGVNYVNTSTRNAKSLNISKYTDYTKKALDQSLYKIFNSAVEDYVTNSKFIHINKDSGYQLVKYETGGFFKLHTDQNLRDPNLTSEIRSRVLSGVVVVNNDFVGGDLCFFDGGHRYIPELSKGDLIIFPSNFLFPHEVTPVTEGTRYSIVTWFS
jgi:hypothetical protein